MARKARNWSPRVRFLVATFACLAIAGLVMGVGLMVWSWPTRAEQSRPLLTVAGPGMATPASQGVAVNMLRRSEDLLTQLTVPVRRQAPLLFLHVAADRPSLDAAVWEGSLAPALHAAVCVIVPEFVCLGTMLCSPPPRSHLSVVPLPPNSAPTHLEALRWARQAGQWEAQAGPTPAWVALVPPGVTVNHVALVELVGKLGPPASPAMVGRSTDAGPCSSDAVILVPFSAIQSALLEESGIGGPGNWLDNAMGTLSAPELRSVRCNSGVPKAHAAAVAAAWPTASAVSEGMGTADLLSSTQLHASVVVPSVQLRWQLQAAWAEAGAGLALAHLGGDSWRPDWATAPLPGSKTPNRVVWLDPVQGSQLLTAPVTLPLGHTRLGAFVESTRARIAEGYGMNLARKAVVVMCRTCTAPTAVFSLPAPASRVVTLTQASPLTPGAHGIFTFGTGSTVLHFAVPFMCRYASLLRMIGDVGEALAATGLKGRVHIGWSACPTTTPQQDAAAQRQAAAASIDGLIEVVVVDVLGGMTRSGNLNAAAAGAASEDLLIMMDADMRVQEEFLLHAVALTVRGASVYFPIVWSRYNPESVTALEEFYSKPVSAYSPAEGNWRHYGYGMVAIFRSDFDAAGGMDEGFKGWGGEDNAFHKRCSRSGLAVMRMAERGLVHVWHGKSCKGVPEDKQRACLGSWAAQEGTGLALLARFAPRTLASTGHEERHD